MKVLVRMRPRIQWKPITKDLMKMDDNGSSKVSMPPV